MIETIQKNGTQSKLRFEEKGNKTIDNVVADEIAFPVYKTMDYDKFKFIDGNRVPKEQDIKKLKTKILKKDYKVPILVTPDGYIVDGQHRFTVRKELGLPIYYFIIDGKPNPETIIDSSSAQKPFEKRTTLDLFVAKGYPEYMKLKEFMTKTKISLSLAVYLTSYGYVNNGGHSVGADSPFALGTYQAKYLDSAYRYVNYIQLLAQASGKENIVRSTKFGAALYAILSIEGFNPNVLIEKFKKFPYLIEVKANRNQYVDMIHNIYNHASRNKINLRVL